MKHILIYLKPYRKRLVAVAGLHMISTLSALVMPYLMSAIVDNGIATGDASVIVSHSLYMGIVALVALATSLLSNKINTTVSCGFTSDLCRGVYRKVNSLSLGKYSSIGSSSLLTRATDDVLYVQDSISGLVETLVTIPIMLIGGTVLSLKSDVVLSLVFFLSIPPVVLFVLFVVKPLGGMWDKVDRYIDIRNRVVRERLSGLRVVRAFNNEPREHERTSEATREMSKYMIRSNVRSGTIEPVATLLLNLASVLILWVGSRRIAVGHITDAGSIIATVQYVTLIANALIMLSFTVAWLPHLRVAVRRIGEVFALESENLLVADIPSTEKSSYFLEVRNLTFAYPDAKADVLRGISLYINEGETVAIIGGTGSGKTTLVRLLLGLYSPTGGEIFFDGTPYGALGCGVIRTKFSVALQRAMVFEGTLRENVRMGRGDATDEEITEALMAVELGGFLEQHEEGLDALLVGSGRNVSGGQKQRISMARAIIRKSEVYVFDDSFSALDFLTERKIKDALKTYLPNKTQIIVTQRVSTSMSADRIFVLDKGQIIGEGTHSELYARCPLYREICDSQLARGGRRDER